MLQHIQYTHNKYILTHKYTRTQILCIRPQHTILCKGTKSHRKLTLEGSEPGPEALTPKPGTKHSLSLPAWIAVVALVTIMSFHVT